MVLQQACRHEDRKLVVGGTLAARIAHRAGVGGDDVGPAVVIQVGRGDGVGIRPHLQKLVVLIESVREYSRSDCQYGCQQWQVFLHKAGLGSIG
jgi:hypothetical protein